MVKLLLQICSNVRNHVEYTVIRAVNRLKYLNRD
uniref:Uncharacterized protein n=1 Tax=Anguilla anguilla TaxID=7936 RepID=A0A0E9UYR0_ANGAN